MRRMSSRVCRWHCFVRSKRVLSILWSCRCCAYVSLLILSSFFRRFCLQPLFVDYIAARLMVLMFVTIVVACRRCFVGALTYWVLDCSHIVMLFLLPWCCCCCLRRNLAKLLPLSLSWCCYRLDDVVIVFDWSSRGCYLCSSVVVVVVAFDVAAIIMQLWVRSVVKLLLCRNFRSTFSFSLALS